MAGKIKMPKPLPPLALMAVSIKTPGYGWKGKNAQASHTTSLLAVSILLLGHDWKGKNAQASSTTGLLAGMDNMTTRLWPGMTQRYCCHYT